MIIARDKEPLVKLAPILKPKQQRQFGSARGLITLADDFDEPLEEFKEYIMTPLTVSLPDELMTRLEELAAKHKVAPEDLVQLSVEELVASPEEMFDSAVGKAREILRPMGMLLVEDFAFDEADRVTPPDPAWREQR